MALEVRRILRIYDNVTLAPPRQAIPMLKEITKCISMDPRKYDLKSDPGPMLQTCLDRSRAYGAAEVWDEAGGSSYCENVDFPEKVGQAWLALLSKPEFLKAGGWDQDELQEMADDFDFWAGKLEGHELKLGRHEEVLELLATLKAQAPEAEDSDEEDDDE